jgi:hypothetical protein
MHTAFVVGCSLPLLNNVGLKVRIIKNKMDLIYSRSSVVTLVRLAARTMLCYAACSKARADPVKQLVAKK